jgi:hypothetical protein
VATKKDYETVARVIGHVMYAIDEQSQVRSTDGMLFGFRSVHEKAIATTMLDVLAGWLSFNFEQENPRFNKVMFREAVIKARQDGPFN